ncbi:HD domain-containing protein [candidate division KSB1 bacterium]|nr:HD domain-containing protein [candidate division KSB1 bacterium]
MGLIPASTLEEAYEQARESLPETFDTLVIPYGALTLPYIDETTPEFIARQGSLILQRTIEYVKRSQQFNTSGHDWWHTWRVWQMAKRLAREEGADMFVVELAALLHDLADWKYTDANEHAASDWLASQQVPRAIIRHVDEIVGTLSFKGAGVDSKMSSLEGKVVQDADRLDAMGAIGIARTFAYGGSKNRLLHSPEIKPVIHQTPEEYKQRVGTTINHFYEKLLLLKERMNTEPARKIAAARHHFLGSFLARFFDEWEGKA